jgi:flagellar operon protein (TIGR03826 family)
MDVRTCRRCKNLYQHITGPEICPRCRRKEEELFQIVKQYLRENPGASMQEVSEETEVPTYLIVSFLRAGRLQIAPNSPIALSCERCGTKILTGRFCNKCSNNLVNDLNEMAREFRKENQALHQDEGKNKMRFLNQNRIKDK